MDQTTKTRLHLYVLLDRSGSMASMRDAVIAGFDGLLAEQRAVAGPEPRITLVQFDTEDPEEVLLDGARLRHARPLTPLTYVPRGGTPLLDATAAIIGRAAARVEQRAVLGKRPESIVVVTITDGHENASQRHTNADVVRLVDAKRKAGWSFAYIGSPIDAYDTAAALGYDARSVQRFAPTPAGASAAFASMSRAVAGRRAKLAACEAFDADDLFGGVKEAESEA